MLIEAVRRFWWDGRQVAVGENVEVDSIAGYTLIAANKAKPPEPKPRRRKVKAPSDSE